ncbi:MerR family transcriptional regulator [Deinococcus arcticus]|uniref:MerR family transcriptional regulator n=1 Tax=Deinococcus arcticus TaxID=2136176 RepID=A0A2T3W9E5_9DEIO|nr:MerR family transcriptional regulator [Deinococcus arcticus]PTA68530.1 MerR family transcriptional regulator [Deinococcus arcticus]
MQRLRIGQVARAAGVSVRAVRHYDQLGLLTAERADNQYRLFAPADIERVRLIQLFLSVGFTLDEIRRGAPCFAGAVPTLGPPREDMAAFYTRKLAALDAQLLALQRVRDQLAQQASAFEAHTPAPTPHP